MPENQVFGRAGGGKEKQKGFLLIRESILNALLKRLFQNCSATVFQEMIREST